MAMANLSSRLRAAICSLSAAVLLSCSAYRESASTPDDLYYSPGRDVPEQGYVDLSERYLRMRSSSPRWRSFDSDFYYWNFAPGVFVSPWRSPWLMGSPWPMWGTPWVDVWDLQWADPWRWHGGFGLGSVYGPTTPWLGFPGAWGGPWSAGRHHYWQGANNFNPLSFNRPLDSRTNTQRPRTVGLPSHQQRQPSGGTYRQFNTVGGTYREFPQSSPRDRVMPPPGAPTGRTGSAPIRRFDQ